MRLVLIIGGVLLTIILLPWVVGALLPSEHTATGSATIDASPEDVFALIVDVERYTQWRPRLDSVELLEAEPLRFRESSDWGEVVFEEVRRDEPGEIVIRIAGDDLPYGGQWTYEIEGAGESRSVLTITEDGFVKSPYYRFMGKVVFGYDATINEVLEATREHFAGAP